MFLRPISGNIDVTTLASKRSELIGNTDILRMRHVIQNNSTCVCLRLPVAAITQKRKLRPIAGLICVKIFCFMTMEIIQIRMNT